MIKGYPFFLYFQNMSTDMAHIADYGTIFAIIIVYSKFIILGQSLLMLSQLGYDRIIL